MIWVDHNHARLLTPILLLMHVNFMWLEFSTFSIDMVKNLHVVGSLCNDTLKSLFHYSGSTGQFIGDHFIVIFHKNYVIKLTLQSPNLAELIHWCFERWWKVGFKQANLETWVSTILVGLYCKIGILYVCKRSCISLC